MATYRLCVIKTDKKSNNTWNVKVRVTHQRKMGYISTDKYIYRDSMDNKYNITDRRVHKGLDYLLTKYSNMELLLGRTIENYSIKQLTDHLKANKIVDIDFFECIDEVIETMRKDKRKGWKNYNTTKNHMLNYSGLIDFPISMVTSGFLENLEKWLRSHKEDGIVKECGDTAIYNYMRCIRATFNAARKKYNNDDIGAMQIKHYPFTRYTMPTPDASVHRNLKIEVIRAIRDKKLSLSRDILGRDVFMMSFYLIGMNTVDLFKCPPVADGRITYNRSKTTKKRKKSDAALISLKVQPELEYFLEKYKGKETAFNFCERYANSENFNKAVDKGLNRIGEDLKLPKSLGSYYARHSWGTIAANDCDIDEPLVGKCLNHSDPTLKITRIYIEKVWKTVDEANRKVIDLLNEENPKDEDSIILN
jgi:hypothetical protein